MRLLAQVIVRIMWCIPGPTHRLANQLFAERQAAMEALAIIEARRAMGD